MSEYMIYKHNINHVVISVSGMQQQSFEVGHKPPYYKYEDLVISVEAMEEIRNWGLSGLKDNMYQDTVDTSNIDPDKLKELDEFISKPRTYGSSNELETKSLVGTFYKTQEMLEDDKACENCCKFNIEDEVAKDIITFLLVSL